jgi:hypothetical protein
MSNLYALCRVGGDLAVKRVSVTQDVQQKIESQFQAQESAFLDGIDEEVGFGGDWKPDADEILVMDAPAEIGVITQALDGNPLALPVVDATNFMGEKIKALFTAVGAGKQRRILIQRFTAQQILARRFSLFLDGDTFKELTAPAFTFDNFIVAIVEGGKLKFKNFLMVKRIFELDQLYEEASDQQIEAFCAHESLKVDDIAAFKHEANESIRKLVHAITKTNILDNYPVADIVTKAKSLGLTVETDDDQIVMPSQRKDIKDLLRFLDDGIYEALLSSKRYITNSKRPFTGNTGG